MNVILILNCEQIVMFWIKCTTGLQRNAMILIFDSGCCAHLLVFCGKFVLFCLRMRSRCKRIIAAPIRLSQLLLFQSNRLSCRLVINITTLRKLGLVPLLILNFTAWRREIQRLLSRGITAYRLKLKNIIHLIAFALLLLILFKNLLF